MPAQLNWNFTGLLHDIGFQRITRFNFTLSFVIINCSFEREYVSIKVSILICMTNKLPLPISVSRVAQTRVCSSKDLNHYLRALPVISSLRNVGWCRSAAHTQSWVHINFHIPKRLLWNSIFASSPRAHQSVEKVHTALYLDIHNDNKIQIQD